MKNLQLTSYLTVKDGILASPKTRKETSMSALTTSTEHDPGGSKSVHSGKKKKTFRLGREKKLYLTRNTIIQMKIRCNLKKTY